jgi:hypothetical protein
MKIFRLIYILFLLIAVGALAGSALTYLKTSNFVRNAERSDGEVVDIEYSRRPGDSTGMYNPVFQFMTKDGRTIRSTSNLRSSSSSYHRGKKVTILYDPENSEDAVIQSFMELYFVALVLGLIGIGFTGFGVGMAGWDILRNAKPAFYRRNGSLVDVTIIGISRASYQVNNVRPWRIDAEWQDPCSGQIYKFQSQNLYIDPARHLGGNTKIGVYVKASNPKLYWMDISFLNSKGESISNNSST